MGLYPVAVCYSERQANKIQYSVIEYNTITHIRQNITHHTMQS